MNGYYYFRIVFIGQPPKQWDDWFGVPARQDLPEAHHVFSGQVQDLAEFVGILGRFQMLNLEPVSIQYSTQPIREPASGIQTNPTV